MMVLFSLKEIYYTLILQGVKRFEFRRRLPASLKKGDQIAIYCSRPISRIVAYVDVEGITQDTPKKVWKSTDYAAGITHEAFMAYFSDATFANAIHIGKIHKLLKPLSLNDVRIDMPPPQSFTYLNEAETKKVKANAKIKRTGLSVFIGGVHGVGKTTFLSQTLTRIGFNCFSASDLIKRKNGQLRSDKIVKSKSIADNQKVLIQQSRLEAARYSLYALDGHFSLRTKTNKMQTIDIEVFADLGIDGIILLEDESEEIKRRLEARDGVKWSKSLIDALIECEGKHADLIARNLGIPMIKLSSLSRNKFVQTKKFVQKIIANKFGGCEGILYADKI